MLSIKGTLLTQDPRMMATPNAFAKSAEKHPELKKGTSERQISGETTSGLSVASQTHLARGETRGMLARFTMVTVLLHCSYKLSNESF